MLNKLGGYQCNIGFNKYMAVSQSSVSRCINEVIEGLNNARIFSKYVNFSVQREDLNRMRKRLVFCSMCSTIQHIYMYIFILQVF